MSFNINDIPTQTQMLAQKHVVTKINHYSGVLKMFWNGITSTQKAFFIILLLVLFFFIFFLVKQKINLNELKSFLDEPIFLTNLNKDKIFSGTNTFVYKDKITNQIVNYIPANIFGEEKNGYTYSFWIYVNVYNPFYPKKALITNKDFVGKNSIVFSRGKNTPGLWLINNYRYVSFGNKIGDNTVKIIMNKWINVTYVVNGNVVNCFKNGELVSSNIIELSKQNGNLYINPNIDQTNNLAKGFPAQLAYLQYYKKPLYSERVYEIYKYYKKYFDDLEYSMIKEHKHNNIPIIPSDGGKCDFVGQVENDFNNVENKIKNWDKKHFDNAQNKLSDWDKQFKNEYDKEQQKLINKYKYDKKKLESKF